MQFFSMSKKQGTFVKNITKYYNHLRGAAQELRTIRLHGSVRRIGVC